MPRDMTATGRYPPNPFHKPIEFYSAVRLGEPDQLAKVMSTDPYFVTQDNGAGAPLHFGTTYKQLDMVRPRDLGQSLAGVFWSEAANANTRQLASRSSKIGRSVTTAGSHDQAQIFCLSC